ncbi:MAG: MFS transporter [Actinomycetota bacterium]|nr:MFS transporter [Actinomycetota bacterium]
MIGRRRHQALTQEGTPRLLVPLVQTLLMFESSLYSVLTPILPHYAHALGASKPAIGVLTGAYTAGLIPGSLLGGWMAARAGVRRTTFTGLALFAVAVAAFGFATDIVALDGLRAIQGFACGGIWGGALTWVIAATPASRRGRVLGAAFSAAILGTLLGPAVGTAAVWLGTGIVFAGLGAIAAGLAAWVLRFPDAAIAPTGDRGSIGGLLRNRALLLGTWLMLLEAGALGVVYTLIPLRLSHFGASSVAIGAIFLVASGVRTLIAPQIGRVSDRRGAIAPTAVGLVLAALVMTAVPLPQSVAGLAVVSVIVMAGPLTAFVIPASSLLTVAAERAGISLAIATMIFNLSFALGQTIGAPVGASLAQATSDAVPFLALAALLLLTLVLVLAWRRQPQVAEAAAPMEQGPVRHVPRPASSPARARRAQNLSAR